jgi:type IV pilus assembly PilX-like protein
MKRASPAWPRRLRAVRRHSRNSERGAALVLAILVLAILTVIGIALMLITSTESRIAANEWSINRAFYASDSGIRWSMAEMTSPLNFMKRPEFAGGTVPPAVALSNAFGSVAFPLPSYRHGGSGFFQGDAGVGQDITVSLQTPSLLGRRFAPGYVMNAGGGQAQYDYAYEVRSTGGQNDARLQYSKALVADVEIGPLPDQLPWMQ